MTNLHVHKQSSPLYVIRPVQSAVASQRSGVFIFYINNSVELSIPPHTVYVQKSLPSSLLLGINGLKGICCQELNRCHYLRT